MISVCSQAWPRTPSNPLASTSVVLGYQACATMPGCVLHTSEGHQLCRKTWEPRHVTGPALQGLPDQQHHLLYHPQKELGVSSRRGA